ncbi:MAG: methyl-accepting chemotaxis protein [Treponema sp.]|nr:methyl-accepting chemotaxis protein [Treponema sp.]
MNFGKRLVFESWAVNSTSLALILFYSIFSSRIPMQSAFALVKLTVPVVAFFIFIVGPTIGHMLYRGVSRQLEQFAQDSGDEKFRTELLMGLQRQPIYCFLLTSAYFLAASVISFLLIRADLRMSVSTRITIFIEWICGSYFAGLIAYSFRCHLCETYAIKIVKAGINHTFTSVKRHFGLSLRFQMILYICIPLLLTTIVTLSLYAFTLPETQKTFTSIAREAFSGNSGIGQISQPHSYNLDTPRRMENTSSPSAGMRPFVGMTGMWSWRIKCTALFNAAIMCAQILIFYLSFMEKNSKTINGLEALRNSNFTGGNPLSSDLSDELSYNIYLLNSLILKFQSVISNSISIATMITESSASLSKISDGTEKSAKEQKSKTDDIIEGMEKNTEMSQEIDNLASEVASSAKETASNMDSSADIMEKTLSNMQAIGESNESTLIRIKELEQKISAIGEIVNMINSIAEQTKIIAFNTELESSTINGDEKSFLNVALETRRLANSIADSTKEIKAYIKQIEATEELLLKYSDSNTNEIKRGKDISNSIKGSFSEINESSKQNADATQEIKEMIKTQTEDFGRIKETIEQINEGINNFSLSASSLVNAAGELKANAGKLSTVGNSRKDNGSIQ